VEWKSERHLEDHYGQHGGKLRCRTIAEYDASAQETVGVGVRFTYRDRITGERRVGYFHRVSSRFVAVDLDGFIRPHYQTDEEHVADLPQSTYHDEGGRHMTAHEQTTSAVSTEVLDTLHRRLVAIHAGLAEHGPSDPKLAVPWTLDELTTVLRYIRAVRRGEATDFPD